jgi:hypothetical protein
MGKKVSFKKAWRGQEEICKEKAKIDYVFLTEGEGRSRICKTEKQCEAFHSKILTLLDEEQQKGLKVGITLDIECDSGQRPRRPPNLHYRAQNLMKGVSGNEIQKRKKNIDIDTTFKKMIKMSIDDDQEVTQFYWH